MKRVECWAFGSCVVMVAFAVCAAALYPVSQLRASE